MPILASLNFFPAPPQKTKIMDSSPNDDQGVPGSTQEENHPVPASPDRSDAQESTVSSPSPNNSPDAGVRTQAQNNNDNIRPAPIDTGISLADSTEANPSPPPLQSVGTEENMTMLENLSVMHSAQRANRAAAAAAAEAEDGGDAPFPSSMYRPGPGFPGRMGRPPLSPTFDSPAEAVDAAESAAASNSGKYMMSPEELSLKQEEDRFYSAPANKAGDDNIWGLLSGVMGNVYEW